MHNVVSIRSAVGGSDLEDVRSLFKEYERSVAGDLCFQDFERELAELPGRYSRPEGILLLAVDSSRAVGCVAVRRLNAETCEMKRLYVRDEARGQGLGRRLAETAMTFAGSAGYRTMRLDTLPSMATAQTLYRVLGFEELEPNPATGVLSMELSLTA